MMHTANILEEVRSACAEVSPGIDWSHVQASDALTTDLGFDSLMMMLLAIRIEDAFGVSIPNNANFHTVADVCNYIEASRNNAP